MVMVTSIEIFLLVNSRETLPHLTFDVELLGDCDRIVNQLCLMLEEERWQGPVHQPRLTQHLGLPLQLPQLSSTAEPSGDTALQVPTAEVTSTSPSVRELTSGQIVDPVAEADKPADTSEDKSNCESESDQPSEGSDNFEKEKGSDTPAASDEVEEMKLKSLADFIPDGNFLYLPPSRYIFPGAEIYHDDSDEEDDAEEEEEDEDDEDDDEDDVENNENDDKDEKTKAETAVALEEHTENHEDT